MNSALQCVANTPHMREFFTGLNYRGFSTLRDKQDPQWKVQTNKLNVLGYEGKFVQSFADLMCDIWKSDAWFPMGPIMFKRALGKVNEDFQGF